MCKNINVIKNDIKKTDLGHYFPCDPRYYSLLSVHLDSDCAQNWKSDLPQNQADKNSHF